MKTLNRFLFTKGGFFRKIAVSRIVKRSGGGSWYSDELREYYKQYLNIEVGRFSYGWESGSIDGPARIGSFVSIGPGVRRLSVNHYMDGVTTHPCYFNPVFGWVDSDFRKRTSIQIGNDVWIGANAVILPNVNTIGDGAVIGAGSIVTKDVDPYAVMAGNPAKKIRDRLPMDIAKQLQESEWWNLPVDQLKQLAPYMKDPKAFLNHLK